ncbi:MAG: hypothetical protein WC378_19635 [Opitutaceae bacterium]
MIVWNERLGNATQTLTWDTRPDCWDQVRTHATEAEARTAVEKAVRNGEVSSRIGIRTVGERLPLATLAPNGWVRWQDSHR